MEKDKRIIDVSFTTGAEEEGKDETVHVRELICSIGDNSVRLDDKQKKKQENGGMPDAEMCPVFLYSGLLDGVPGDMPTVIERNIAMDFRKGRMEMADKEIKITFPEKKMEALVFFLGEQNEKIEDVLTAHLDKTYEKYVPQQVRKFVESQMAVAQEEVPVRMPRARRQTGEQGEPVRRNARQGTRQSASRQEACRTAGETVTGENEAAEAVEEPEEAQGMSMGM